MKTQNKRASFGKISALFAAAAGLLAPSVAKSTQSTDANNQVIERRAVYKLPSAAELITSKTQYGGGDVGNSYHHNVGIPPKIYGTYYVKRGTHKRSNKRK